MDRQDTLNLLSALRRYGRDEILKHFDATSCIASTRVAINVLAHYGIHAEPLPVSMLVFNAEATRLLETGGTPLLQEKVGSYTPEMAGGPWSIGVGASPNPGPNGWAGHLIVVVPEHHAYLDLSADQASRPHKNIEMSPHYFELDADDPWAAGQEPLLQMTGDHGLTLLYDRRAPDPYGFRASPNWTGAGRSGRALAVVTANIIALVDAHLTAATPAHLTP